MSSEDILENLSRGLRPPFGLGLLLGALKAWFQEEFKEEWGLGFFSLVFFKGFLKGILSRDNLRMCLRKPIPHISRESAAKTPPLHLAHAQTSRFCAVAGLAKKGSSRQNDAAN